MGVFKWLRRERVTVTQDVTMPATTTSDPVTVQRISEQLSQSATEVGTIRTEQYKRDLAEFQARRSAGAKESPESLKTKCGRHSLPISCTACTTDPDATFNYEKKSAVKYKKKTKRNRSMTPDDRHPDPSALPNIQFLFQNQVFMPGNVFQRAFTEPKSRRQRKLWQCDSAQKQLNFSDDQTKPLFYVNNALPVEVDTFLRGVQSVEVVDGVSNCTEQDDKESKSSHSSKQNVKNDDSSVWEVMNELKNLDQWADEQLLRAERVHSSNKSDDSKSDTSAYGLPIASAINLDIDMGEHYTWNQGSWGLVPVQMKKLTGVTVEHVRKKANMEINILRKYRHPNIILLMGIYPDILGNVYIICERCVDSLYGIIHVQGRIISAQNSVHYALDIANALVFLRMQGFIHTELTSHSIMVTSRDAAKLSDLGPCVRLERERKKEKKAYEFYSPEPQYVNIEGSCNGAHYSTTPESEPLISQHPSETYLISNAVSKPCEQREHYRWQAPELFVPDDDGTVHPCSKSDVYSLCLILWECCNAAMPWKTLTYEKLKELYILWKTGIRLPQDGTYPGSLLALLQSGLKLSRAERIDLNELQTTLYNVKRNLDALECILIPAQLSKKKSDFSSTAWGSRSPTDDESDCLSPLSSNFRNKAVVHKTGYFTESSERDSTSENSPLYETLRDDKHSVKMSLPVQCYVSDEDNVEERPALKHAALPDKDFSSACSTPLAKVQARIKNICSPGDFQRSDSTEYCSFLSPDNLPLNDSSKTSVERPTAKLSRSFTPKSYKPLHIKVPECNLDSVKSILKDNSASERSCYNFDIKNYSLPSTPIARSNKLRRNAWLSGDINLHKTTSNTSKDEVKSAPDTPTVLRFTPVATGTVQECTSDVTYKVDEKRPSCASVDTGGDGFSGVKRDESLSNISAAAFVNRCASNTLSMKSSQEPTINKVKVDDELANVNVKPLVAIHERWIYEANRKPGRSMSLPDENKSAHPAVKPASHRVDTLQNSRPPQNGKKIIPKAFRGLPISPTSSKKGIQWEQFCQAREAVAKSMHFGSRDEDSRRNSKKDGEKQIPIPPPQEITNVTKADQGTDTLSIEDFIRDIIRKEFQSLKLEIADDSTTNCNKFEDLLNRRVDNIVETLKNGEEHDETVKKDVKAFSRVKINGNNKPLLQITFNRSGENSLQVLDNCVNVTICDNNGRDKMNVSMDDTLKGDDVQVQSLKRCQTFNAIQEARSTEDLYIDDDLSTHMCENFGGRVKLIPLHGSLHEILCEKEDDCCLIKVKQENGCDTIYFKCDNSDTESRDAIDGVPFESTSQDTVVYKRSISLVEERIKRVFPKEMKVSGPIVCRRSKSANINPEKVRPKSEDFVRPISKVPRALSSSTPSLAMKTDKIDEVEVNIENVMSYQDSSSEECIKCKVNDEEFEMLEKKIEEDMAKSLLTSYACLQKISEENLSNVE